jgi:biotin synthase-like enzyme
MCVTLRVINGEQAAKLNMSGLDDYNHQIDTSPDFYEKQSQPERLMIAQNAQKLCKMQGLICAPVESLA